MPVKVAYSDGLVLQALLAFHLRPDRDNEVATIDLHPVFRKVEQPYTAAA